MISARAISPARPGDALGPAYMAVVTEVIGDGDELRPGINGKWCSKRPDGVRRGWCSTLDDAVRRRPSWARPGDVVVMLGVPERRKIVCVVAEGLPDPSKRCSCSRGRRRPARRAGEGACPPRLLVELEPGAPVRCERGAPRSSSPPGARNRSPLMMRVDALVVRLEGPVGRGRGRGRASWLVEEAANAVRLHLRPRRGAGGAESACAILATRRRGTR